MPMSGSVVNEVNFYFYSYKKSGQDVATNGTLIDSMLIDIANTYHSDDEAWIKLILSFSEKAALHKIKPLGLLPTFTQTVTMATHRFLREINKAKLDAYILHEKAHSKELLKYYSHEKQEGSKDDVINSLEKDIDNSLISQAYLGDKTELIRRLTRLEIKAARYFSDSFYEYASGTSVGHVSHVNTNLPLELQHENQIFERIFLEKFFYGIRPAQDPSVKIVPQPPSTTAEEKTSPSAAQEKKEEEDTTPFTGITEQFVKEELWIDLKNYTDGKTRGSDADIETKKRECGVLKDKLLLYAKNKEPLYRWFAFIIEIGTDAHKSQTEVKFYLSALLKPCSGHTEVLSKVRLKLLVKIKETAAAALLKRHAKELDELTKAQDERIKAVWANQTAELEQQKQDESVRHNAYLGNLEPLYELNPDAIDRIFYGSYNDHTYALTPLSWVTGTIIVGYEYCKSKQPYGLPESDKISPHAPFCLQFGFINGHDLKHKVKINVIKGENTTYTKANEAIGKISADLETLYSDVRIRKLVEVYEREENVLSAFGITPQTIQEFFQPKIRELDIAVTSTNTLITSLSNQTKKEELLETFRIKQEQMTRLTQALGRVQSTLAQAQSKKQQEKKDAEERAALEAKKAIKEFNKTLTQLMEIRDQDPSQVTEKITSLDDCISKIKKLISDSGTINSTSITVNLWTPEFERFEKFKEEIAQKNKPIEQAPIVPATLPPATVEPEASPKQQTKEEKSETPPPSPKPEATTSTLLRKLGQDQNTTPPPPAVPEPPKKDGLQTLIDGGMAARRGMWRLYFDLEKCTGDLEKTIAGWEKKVGKNNNKFLKLAIAKVENAARKQNAENDLTITPNSP